MALVERNNWQPSWPAPNRDAAAMAISPKFCIFGAGATGGMVATLLAHSGATVGMVTRGQTLAALKRDGAVSSPMVKCCRRVSESATIPRIFGVQDYVIIAVKAPSLPELARQIGPLLGPRTDVVTAMNGVPPWWFFLKLDGELAGHRLEVL